jgi:two-component system cell cycle response regulator DivK
MTGKRILYIEDNSDNRLLIKRVLEAEGYTVIEADTGLKGLELAASSQPDLVLMDINLPEIDGYECTHRMRKVPGGEKVPIVALTANAMEGDSQKALDAGCDGYIPKPIDVDHLPSQIEKYLKKPEAGVSQPVSPPPVSVQPPVPPIPGPSAPAPSPAAAAPGTPAPSAPAPSAPSPSTAPSPSAPTPSSPSPSVTPPSTPTSSGVPSTLSVPANPSPQPVSSPSLSPQVPGTQVPGSQPQNGQEPKSQDQGSQN